MSGSDIDQICDEANNKAVTRLLKWNYFHISYDKNSQKPVYTPCEPDGEAVKIDIMEIPNETVSAKPIATFDDVLERVRKAKPRVNAFEIKILEQFAEEKGVSFERLNNEFSKKSSFSFLEYFGFLDFL